MSTRFRAALAATAALVLLLGAVPTAAAAPRDAVPGELGSLLTVSPIRDRHFALPGAGSVYDLTYLSRGAGGTTTPVRATLWLPSSKAPRGGHPVMSYGHGTIGLGDDCRLAAGFGQAGPGYGKYLGPWLTRGFAVVATEYAGIGGPGVHPYLDTAVAGANVIDAVRAARAVGDRVGVPISADYATDGGSQGGHASLSASAVADEYAPELRLVGAAAVAPPVHIDRYLSLLGPHVPNLPVPDYAAYLAYVLRGLKASRPQLDVERYLTPVGRGLYRAAEKLCYRDMVARSAGIGVGAMLARPLSSGPILSAIRAVQVVPTRGHRSPVLIHQGVADVTAFAPLTEQFAADARRAGASVRVQWRLAGHGVGPEAQVESARWAARLVN